MQEPGGEVTAAAHDGTRDGARGDGRQRLWMLVAGLSIVFGAAWLRVPAVPYLAVAAGATAASAVAALRLARARSWALAHALVAALFCVAGAAAQRTLARVDRGWEGYSEELTAGALGALRGELSGAAAALRESARRALDAPSAPLGAFAFLSELPRGDAGERGVVLYRNGRPVAWAGSNRVATDSLRRSFEATFSPFYVTLHAVAERGSVRAVATALVHAEPPADRFAAALDARVVARGGVRAFEFESSEDAGGAGTLDFEAGGRPLITARAVPLGRGEFELRVLGAARARGAAILALAIVCFAAAAWRRPTTLPVRLLALAAPVAAVAIVPLNEFSNLTRLFDPSYYYAPFGGAFTASVGALGITTAVLLLGLLAVLRAPSRFPSRLAALAVVLLVAGLGPFLLRDLARGIAPPAEGVPVWLWLSWEVTIFLAASSVLVAGASAGRAVLGSRRGLPPLIAPTVAAGAALLAPVLWEAPGQWPGWFPALWIAAIAALALARRTPGFVLTAAAVAGFGAATLVWGATARKKVELAERDVAGLSSVDPYAASLLERFAGDLGGEDVPTTREGLLQRYVRSDLAAADYPVELTAWASDTAPGAQLVTSSFGTTPESLTQVVADASRSGAPIMRSTPGSLGVLLLLAVPHGGRGVTTVVVAPRTRLITGDPYAALLGVAPAETSEPPYSLSLVSAPTTSAMVADTGRWVRRGSELHGDWIVRTAAGAARAHVEVELRSLDALVQRGALVVLVDLAIVLLLWTLSAVADDGFGRWLRARSRRWARSYRTQLTLALFTFFVVPAVAFALWSYRRLQSDDRESRELLVRETLRAVAGSPEAPRIADLGDRLDAPLFLYEEGELRLTSDSLYATLAPVGRFLRPDVQLGLGLAGEVTANAIEAVGASRLLFGYRAATTTTGDRVVLAAPARTGEVTLDRRRRDLSVLVLFATAVGAIAAFWLSGIAARQFARPIGALRRAALAIAAGEREPLLTGEPPEEFVPVFSAFRRMAADLSASQFALEEAQRRTAAILRNVASGVIAVDRGGAVTLANPRAEALLGCALPPGTPLSSACVPALDERVRDFAAGAAEEEEFDLDLHGRQLHGRLTRLTRGGGGAVLTLDDVTELARAQRVLAWGEMARQVAHEIKNPLTPIRLGVQHLRRAHADRRRDFDQILDQNVGRILGEIDRLDEIARAFSRYGTAPAERAALGVIDAAAVTRDVVDLERMGEGAVEWTLRGADAPAPARAGADELREVLLNLLENARLAGSRRVSVVVARDDGRVAISVEDDGEGIPDHVLPRIFEPHFSTRTSGSGLGLAISRRIVDGWGGDITVASERGRGTTVVVSLLADENALPET